MKQLFKNPASVLALIILLMVNLQAGISYAQGVPQTNYPYATPPIGPNASVVGNNGAGGAGTTRNFSPSSMSPVSITRSAIPTTHVTSNGIVLSGYATAGDLGAGAVYSSVGATSTGWGAIQDAGGIWFNLVFTNGTTNPGWFGAKGDDGATTLSSGDITAHPEWRGCYQVGDTWDTVGIYEGILAAFATASTPCTGGVTTHFLWNIQNGMGNLRYFIPTAQVLSPSLTTGYGITKSLFWAASGAVWEQSSGGCIDWKGSPSVTPMKTDSVSFFHWFGRPCLINNTRAATAAAGVPIWTIDHDGSSPGGVTTQEILVENGEFQVKGLNQQGISINPVGGSAAEGANIVFNNTLFFCNAGQSYAIRNFGNNALANMMYGGDMEGCSQDGIYNNGGNFDVLAATFENQDLTGFFGSPRTNQFLRNGADFHSFGAVGTSLSRFNIDRSESDVSMLCVGGCVANLGAQMAQADLVPWSANTTNIPGSVVTSSTAPGHIFMLANTSGLVGPNQGWRNSGTGSTACTINDNGPGSTGWSTNQWVGFNAFWRFSNGFSANVGPIRWNNSTQVSWCMETNSQISGNTLTVNSLSAGGNHIATGNNLVAPNMPSNVAFKATISGTTMTVTSIVSEFGTIVPGGLLTGAAGGTIVVSQLSGTTGGVGTYQVSISQTIPTSTTMVQPWVSITALGSGTGGTGTYTISQTMPTVGASAMEIGPVNVFTIPPPADEQYTIYGFGGSSTPAFAGVQGQHVLGFADGGNGGFGVSTTAGSTTLTVGGGITAHNGDWIMIPNGTTVGNPVTFPSSAALNTGFFASLSGCSGSTCTMSVAADQTMSLVSAYESAPITDNQDIWMDLDANIFQGMVEVDNAVYNSGRVEAVGKIGQLDTLRTDFNRGGVFPNSIGGSTSPNWGSVTGFNDRTVPFPCGSPAPGTTAWPVGQGNDYTCLLNNDFTITAPPTTLGRAAYITFNVVEPSNVAHTVTFGSGFVIPQQFTPTFTTSGTTGDERSFLFVEDGTAGWVEVAGPNVRAFVLPARVSGDWYLSPVTGTSFTTASITTTYFAPLVIRRAVGVQALGVWLQTGVAASAIQLAVYPDNGTGSPLLTGGPLMSTTSITTTASAVNVNGSVTPATLQPGLYWAAVMSNNAGVGISGVSAAGQNNFDFGVSSQANLQIGTSQISVGYTLTGQTFGTWPTSGSPAVNPGTSVGPLLQYESQDFPLLFLAVLYRRRKVANDNAESKAA